ncbi:MAG: hypothetical protein LBT09_04195 [Planctomycetaceae bacterium]|jgi:hypothetical protein|nr:hypothetical protein [Planctomycetaceae bacterium]
MHVFEIDWTTLDIIIVTKMLTIIFWQLLKTYFLTKLKSTLLMIFVNILQVAVELLQEKFTLNQI